MASKELQEELTFVGRLKDGDVFRFARNSYYFYLKCGESLIDMHTIKKIKADITERVWKVDGYSLQLAFKKSSAWVEGWVESVKCKFRKTHENN